MKVQIRGEVKKIESDGDKNIIRIECDTEGCINVHRNLMKQAVIVTIERSQGGLPFGDTEEEKQDGTDALATTTDGEAPPKPEGLPADAEYKPLTFLDADGNKIFPQEAKRGEWGIVREKGNKTRKIKNTPLMPTLAAAEKYLREYAEGSGWAEWICPEKTEPGAPPENPDDPAPAPEPTGDPTETAIIGIVVGNNITAKGIHNTLAMAGVRIGETKLRGILKRMVEDSKLGLTPSTGVGIPATYFAAV